MSFLCSHFPDNIADSFLIPSVVFEQMTLAPPTVYTRGDNTKVTNGGTTEQTALLGNGQTTYSDGHFGVAENPNTDGPDFCGQNALEDEARR
jgi:hypothetical protein